MSIRKNVWFCSLILLSVFNGLAQNNQPSNTITLKQAVETAITNNLTVKQSELDMETAAVNWKQSKANRYPSLNGVANHGINQGRSIDPFTNSFSNQQISYAGYGLSTGVVLFNGFGIHNTIKQNAYAYDAAKLEVQQDKDNITLNVILMYLQVLNNDDLLAQSRSQADVTRRQVERLEILNKEGAIVPALVYDLKGQLANDELAVVNNRNALNASRLSLSQLMNVPYNENLQLERINADQFATTYGETIDKIYQSALEQLALVKAADLRRKSAEMGVKAAKGDRYPILSLSGNLSTNYSSAAARDIFLNTVETTTTDYVLVNGNKMPVIRNQNNFSTQKIKYNDQLDNNLFTSVNLGLRIPIFNAFQVKQRVELAKINQKSTEYIEQTTKIQLRQSIEQAYFNMTAAQDRYKTIVEQVNAFTESFRAAEIRFNEGVGTSVDYIIAKNNLDRANINLISARYDYVLRTKILDYYQSKPLW